MSKLTVPIMVLEGSDQAKDIKNSKGPNDIWQECYRVKQYVKDDELGLTTHPNTLEFPQPYQAAHAKTRCGWNAGNRVFLGQMAGCNINCPYCFVGDNDSTRLVTTEDYASAYWEYNAQYPERMAGVMRISGGEPLMTDERQNWISELLWDETEAYIWLDTNLTTKPNKKLKDTLDEIGKDGNVGVCSCFKPGVDGVDIYEQLEVAKELAEVADIYFYWPSWGGSLQQFKEFLHVLENAIPHAPLRLTVIRIKFHYAAVKAEAMGYNVGMEDTHSAENFRDFREAWKNFCEYTYPKDMLWLPSNEIELG